MVMKILMRLIQTLCLFIVILPLAIQPVEATRGIKRKPIAPSGKKVKGDQWLFVIGIDTYIEWPRLQTAVNDVRF